MRICAFKHCSNSTYTLNRWMKRTCKRHKMRKDQCSCQPPFALFPFPTEKRDPQARVSWTKAVGRVHAVTGENWTPNQSDRICSKHFIEEKPTTANPNPTIYLVQEDIQTPRKPQKKKTRSSTVLASTTRKSASSSRQVIPTHTHSKSYECSCILDCANERCISKDARNGPLVRKFEELEDSSSVHEHFVVTTPESSFLQKVLKTDEKVSTYTGLPSIKAFEELVQLVTPHAPNLQYQRGSQSRVDHQEFQHVKSEPAEKLDLQEELLITLMKLKLGLINQLLGDIFGVSATSISLIFNTYIRMLSHVLDSLIFWPPKEHIRARLPKALQSSPNLRVIIDCTEVLIEQPKHLTLQAETWSDYKQHNTVKVLVGIAPNGPITFLSKACGGRTSEKKIISDSGLLDLLDSGDLVMADQEFPIQEDLLLHGVKPDIPPPGSTKEAMTGSNVPKIKVFANARIHVEQATGRMKRFSLLTRTLPIALVPLVDDIFTVCAGLCNLRPPLVL